MHMQTIENADDAVYVQVHNCKVQEAALTALGEDATQLKYLGLDTDLSVVTTAADLRKQLALVVSCSCLLELLVALAIN